jgi:Family of unknown function (DUF6174)
MSNRNPSVSLRYFVAQTSAFAVALCTVGCGGGCSGSGPLSLNLPLLMLERAQTQWQASQQGNYQFTLATTCYCLSESPITIVVNDRRVQSAYLTDTLEALGPIRVGTLPTLEDLYTVAANAYSIKDAQVEVGFHATLGHVQTLYIDLILPPYSRTRPIRNVTRRS